MMLVSSHVGGVTQVFSAWAVECTDCISAEEEDLPPMSVLIWHKNSNGEASVILEFCGMHSNSSLPSPPQVHFGQEW